MYTSTKKLKLIEALIKTENQSVLQAIEKIVSAETLQNENGNFSASLGLLSPEEADAMKQSIEDNFEKINPDDWK